MTHLDGRLVLVTGAASGIGRRLAGGAAARGARVIGWDVDADGLHDLGGTLALAQVVDVSDPAAVTAAAAQARAELGPVDVLVNNAGVVTGLPLLDLTDTQIERVIAVNALAPFWCTRAVLPDMVDAGTGHIVTIASLAAALGVPRQVDYAASKHAAYGFAESLRVELARTAPRLRTTVVLPFYVNTGMFEGARTRVPWLLPILDETKVAERVLRAVEHDEQRVILPPVGRLAFLGQLLPTGWFDRLADLVGVHVSMDDFHGRSVPAAPPRVSTGSASRGPDGRSAAR